MDGYELAQRAAATRPGLQVIMLSGREIDGRGWPVVRKPFLEEDLAHTMKQTTGALLGAAAARALDGDGEPRAFGAELHNAAQHAAQRSRPVGSTLRAAAVPDGRMCLENLGLRLTKNRRSSNMGKGVMGTPIKPACKHRTAGGSRRTRLRSAHIRMLHLRSDRTGLCRWNP